MECCEQSFGGWVWLVSLGEVGADVAGGLGGDPDVAHVGAAGEGEAGDEGDADPGPLLETGQQHGSRLQLA